MRNNIKSKRWAYLAGLLDGDGSICLTEYESPIQVHFFFMVKVVSTKRSQINWLVQQFGGQLGKYEDKRENNNPSYTWLVKGKHSISVLEGVIPYLVLKQKVAKIGLEYVSLPEKLSDPSLRSKYAKKMCFLNQYFEPSFDRPFSPLLLKPSVLPKEKLAYAAGLLDAEGTFSVPTKTAQSPQIQLSSTDQRMLDWMYYTFGGIVFSSKKKNVEHRDAGLWRYSGGRSQKPEYLSAVKKSKELFLLSVLPYMVQKREQAILSLALLRGDKSPQYCYEQMKKLNVVGTLTTNTRNTSSEVKIESDPYGDIGCEPIVILDS